ncbi:MAG: lysozyme inhibitor LprI family protein [Reyranellales bacterium]
MKSPWEYAAYVAAFWTVAAGPALAQTPTFDCAKAKSRIGKAICADPDLTALDIDLSTAYRAAVKANPATSASQRAWLGGVDLQCADRDEGTLKSCIQWVFEARRSILKALAAGSSAAPVTIGNIAISVNNDDKLCRLLVIDEAKLSDKPGYERQPGDIGEVPGRLSDSIPLRGHIVSLRNIGEPLSEFDRDGTEIRNFSNDGKAEIVYRVAQENNAFNGSLFVVTDHDVPRERVTDFIAGATLDAGSVDAIGRIAISKGWNAFTGGDTPYEDVRYSRMYPLRFDGATYLLVEPWVAVPKPIAILVKPSRPNILKTVCVFEHLRK